MQKLLNKLNNTNFPIRIAIRPEPYATENSCFYNVRDKIKNDGGEIIYGWKLHETEFLLEAERHAIWQSDTGELIDVTPDKNYRSYILFLEEDKNWKYNGEYTGNVIVNNTSNPFVEDLIIIDKIRAELTKTGSRKSRTVVEFPEVVLKLMQFLENDRTERLKALKKGFSIHDNCFCGSEKKYLECHGWKLENVLYSALQQVKTKIKCSF